MKILIVYASRNGTVRTCVERLANGLSGKDVTVCDLAVSTPAPEEYDIVIAGTSVRFERLLRPMRDFLKEHEAILREKKLYLFLCCGLPHESEYYLEKLFPRTLRESACEVVYFGGSLRLDGLPFFDKLIVRSIRSSIAESEIEDGEYTPSMPGILPEAIDRLATQIRRL